MSVKVKVYRTFLVVQCIRIPLPMQRTQVRLLAQEIPHTMEQLSPYTMMTKARVPGVCTPQEKPLQQEACTPPPRVASTRHN